MAALFLTFVKVGFLAFGGGYAMIPVIETEVTAQGWLTSNELTEIIALASSAPGPIATNCAILIGFQVGGLSGAVIAGVGSLLPPFVLVLLLAKTFQQLRGNRWLDSAFYGLRPVITGFIAFAGVNIGLTEGWFDSLSGMPLDKFFMTAVYFIILYYSNVHPLVLILGAGLIGVILY